jgi:hypothetical protein
MFVAGLCSLPVRGDARGKLARDSTVCHPSRGDTRGAPDAKGHREVHQPEVSEEEDICMSYEEEDS